MRFSPSFFCIPCKQSGGQRAATIALPLCRESLLQVLLVQGISEHTLVICFFLCSSSFPPWPWGGARSLLRAAHNGRIYQFCWHQLVKGSFRSEICRCLVMRQGDSNRNRERETERHRDETAKCTRNEKLLPLWGISSGVMDYFGHSRERVEWSSRCSSQSDEFPIATRGRITAFVHTIYIVHK